MKCINFDDKFAAFTAQWVKEHGSEYRNYDAMEADMPRIYMMFLNTPAKWLDGVTPGAYFSQYEDAKDLVDWMVEYCRREIPVPDMLLEQIQAVGKPCEKRLLALLKDEDEGITEEARMTAIGLLRDMESTLPKMLYITWQLNREDHDDLADNALDSLREMGAVVVQPMLQELPRANRAGQEALLDVLVNYPGNQQVFDLAVRLFKENPMRRALFASYLGKLGDDRALPVLMEAAEDEKCRYMDFIELRSAIESLGGEAPKREFFEDAEYDALRSMEGED
ncbi:MAG: HEAT repeat domain-containing protein [Clostridia bacterium]|nr:HEAT repeat domain-containing protein [Clostridia bacterium]